MTQTMPTQTTTIPKPGPVVTELTRTYWAAAEDGTLLIQQLSVDDLTCRSVYDLTCRCPAGS